MSTVPVELAATWVASGAVDIVDVRTPSEFSAAHIPSSVNVPLDDLRARPCELIESRTGRVLLVCRSDRRARDAHALLAGAGVSGATVLTGGLLAWEAAGEPVNRGAARWDLERQVRLVAGSLVVAGVAGSLLWRPAAGIAAAVGAGLTVSALTNTCTMARVLSRLPYNRACGAGETT